MVWHESVYLGRLDKPAARVRQHPDDVLGEPRHAAQVRHYRMAQRQRERRTLRLLPPLACIEMSRPKQAPHKWSHLMYGHHARPSMLCLMHAHGASHAVDSAPPMRGYTYICQASDTFNHHSITRGVRKKHTLETHHQLCCQWG